MTTTTATSGTGGILQSLGVGSGIDINSLVTQLVTADTQPDTARIARETSQVGTGISAIGQLKGALATFQSSLNSLNSQSDFQVKTATPSDATIFTAAAGTAAAAGTYQVQVQNLAQSQQILSKPIAGDGTGVLGSGSLTLTLGSSTFTVTLDSSHSSLSAIRDAINSASDNPGIGATIVHGTDQNGTTTSQLVLSSNRTGAANTITVAANGGDGGLNTLAYNGTNTANYTSLQEAKDASIIVAGVTASSPTNVVSNAIDGVTINLLAAKPDTKIALTIANDNSTVTSRLQTFVNSYNTLQGVIAKLGNYDAASQVAGPLLGDSLLDGISSQIRRTLTNSVPSAIGQYNSLASIGITTNSDGSLTLDTNKLSNVLNSNFNAVSTVFGATDGVATKLSTFIGAQLAAGSGIDTRNQKLATQQKQIDAEQTAATARKAVITARLTAQFTTMDTLLAQMQQTSSYLTQQFANLAKTTSGNASGN